MDISKEKKRDFEADNGNGCSRERILNASWMSTRDSSNQGERVGEALSPALLGWPKRPRGNRN